MQWEPTPKMRLVYHQLYALCFIQHTNLYPQTNYQKRNSEAARRHSRITSKQCLQLFAPNFRMPHQTLR